MKVLKKLLIWIFLLFPVAAFALPAVVTGIGAAIGGLAGFSIWRSASPVNIREAFDFFSSCWTCQIFSDVMVAMSNLLPAVYKSLGRIVIPMSIALLAVLFAWRLFSGFVNAKIEDGYKLAGNFSSYAVKLTVLIGLLLMPLPHIITSVMIEPAVTLGTSLDYIVSPNNRFSECMVTTAVLDQASRSEGVASYGAFSPNLRHQLTCEIANIHQITGLGITVGWAMINMAFDSDYMYKIFSDIPVFPNVGIFLVGIAILIVYFFALLPIPIYFLGVFVQLALNLILLPIMLMAWMFDKDNFAIFPQGGKTIREMIDDALKAVIGIALTVVFLNFSVLFLNVLFSGFDMNILGEIILQNDSKKLMDGLMLNNSSLIVVLLVGVFIAMFMTMIPKLTDMLFKIKISDEYYQTAKKDVQSLWGDLKKWGSAIKK